MCTPGPPRDALDEGNFEYVDCVKILRQQMAKLSWTKLYFGMNYTIIRLKICIHNTHFDTNRTTYSEFPSFCMRMEHLLL